MAIDRIGKGAPPPAPETPGAGSAERRGPTESTFSVDRTEGGAPAKPVDAATATDPTSPLGRLRAGEINVDGYVDLKVDEATRGLEGLSPAELHDIKKILRDQMATDPALSDLVRSATGQIPTEPEE